jgi:WD40 repeat protein
LAAGRVDRRVVDVGVRRAWIAWTIGAGAAAFLLVAFRVGCAIVASAPRPPAPPVAMHGGDLYGDPLPEGATARLGTFRFRGKGPAVWAPDGEHLFVGGWDDTILAMNAKTGLVDWTLPGHSTPFLPNIEVTDVDDMWRVLRYGRLPLESDDLTGLVMFPDGKRLLSEGYSLRVWDLKSRAEVLCIPLRGGNAWGAKISPDGRFVACPCGEWIRMVDLVAGKERRMIQVGSDKVGVQCVAWSADGARVFAGLDDGRLAVVPRRDGTPINVPLSDCAIDAVLVADEGRALWTLDRKRVLTIRSLASASTAPRRIDLGADDDPKPPWWPGSLTASPDGRVVAAFRGARDVRFFDATTAAPVDGPAIAGLYSPLGWSPDGRRFGTWWAGALRIVGDDTTSQPETIVGRLGYAAWSPDGRFVATMSYAPWNESSISVWDAATGRRSWTFEREPCWWLSSAAWTADGAEVVASFAQRVVGFDAATGARRWTYDVPGKTARWPTLSPNGEGAAWVDDERDLHVVDLRGGPREIGVVHLGTKPAADRPPMALLPDLSGAVLLEHVPIKVNADGSWTGQLRVRVWRIGGSAPAVEADASSSGPLAVTRDGRFAAAGGSEVVVLDVAAAPPREIGRIKIEQRDEDREWRGFTAAAFSCDGSSLALGDSRGVVHVYAMPSLVETKTFRGHRAQITSVAFSDDGARLVSGSVDATALVWSLR